MKVSHANAENVITEQLPGGRWSARTVGPDGGTGISAEGGTRNRAIAGLFARMGGGEDEEEHMQFLQRYMPVSEAAERLGVHVGTVRAWCREQSMPHVERKGRYYVERRRIAEMIERWESGG
jgi:excisionase family DNA binding protein